MVIGFAASVITDYTGLTDMIGGAAVLLFAAVLGLAVRYRYAACEQLIERAKLTERELLARELHDTVAHHVSAIAIQERVRLLGGTLTAGPLTDRIHRNGIEIRVASKLECGPLDQLQRLKPASLSEVHGNPACINCRSCT